MLKKDNLIRGTLILTVAALTARVLGLFQRVPLDYMLGSQGMIAFTIANQVYMVLLIIATAGFPSAVSKMVSERYALGQPAEAKRIFHAALAFGAITGVILSATLFIVAPTWAKIADLPSAYLAIRAIAPALLLFPIIAMMRGYFQGRQLMSAGGISQIVEQFMRVLLGLGLGLIVLDLGWGDDWAAAAVTFGSVFGSIGAFGVMIWFGRKLKRQDQMEQVKVKPRFNAEASAALMMSSSSSKSVRNSTVNQGSKTKFRKIYREILAMSLPALLTSMTVNLIYLFDTSFFKRLTSGFYTAEMSDIVQADYGIKAISLAGIPPILAIALGSTIIPVISSAFSVNNMKEVQKQASLVMRIVCFTGVPVALLLAIASYSVTGLLFVSPSGSDVVALLTIGTIVQITMMTTNSILYGMSRSKTSMYHTATGLLLKVVISVATAPFIGIYGLILGSTICFIVITMLNVRTINQIVTLRVLGKRWVPYLSAVAIAGLAGWLSERGVLLWTTNLPNKVSYFISASVTAAVVGALYVALLFVFKVITADDLHSFPNKLRKPLEKIMRIFTGNQKMRSK
ncbi:polysaccharide biosynthesis C-terminal domain-containing protein [Paenibacillus yanchengensis]|uniref:Polysaccharide biosynthesis C-terminal domain-containing protein n=1 Tax=Paenibacillus yanchengensis TaxID=2035833 RepID=A0ABW4YQH2_9BACL